MSSFVAMRLAGIDVPESLRMARECAAQGGVDLARGPLGLPVPQWMRARAAEALERGSAPAPDSFGLPELRRAIAMRLEGDNQLDTDPERDIVVTCGARGAITAALHAGLDPGDGVILLDPSCAEHLAAVTIAGLEAHVATLASPDFAVTDDLLTAAVRDNSAAILLGNPADPSGRVMTEEELEHIGRVAAAHNLLVIADERHHPLHYSGETHICAASMLDLTERTVTAMEATVPLCAGDWCVGWAIAPEQTAAAIGLVAAATSGAVPGHLQAGVAAGLAAPEPFAEVASAYEKKRDILCAGIEAAGMMPLVPQGGCTLLADITHTGFSRARDAANNLLAETGVAAVPGTAFFRGGRGEHFLRFCFARDDAVLADAAARMRGFR